MPDDLTKILWHSNAPWVGTGYGGQSALHVPAIQRLLPYEFDFSAFYGLRGARLQWPAPDGEAFTVYPGGRNPYGNDVIGAHWKHSGADFVLTLTDPWVLDYRICSRIPMAAWIPVDHDPLMPRTDEWVRKSGAVPIAMSRFGFDRMAEQGLDPLYVPHAFDPACFAPLADRRAMRKSLGIPEDGFLVGIVAANKGNPSRKGFSEALQGFALLQEAHPDANLYIHSQLEDPEGINIPALCEACGVVPLTSDPYGIALGGPAAHVGALMNCFDVLLNAAHGEGFGVPLIEAQACGTPVVCTDFSAQPEVAPYMAGNWNVEGQKVWTPFDSFQRTPSVEGIAEALRQAYEEPENERRARRASVAAWASSEYSIDAVVEEYWSKALLEIERRIKWSKVRVVRAGG